MTCRRNWTGENAIPPVSADAGGIDYNSASASADRSGMGQSRVYNEY